MEIEERERGGRMRERWGENTHVSRSLSDITRTYIIGLPSCEEMKRSRFLGVEQAGLRKIVSKESWGSMVGRWEVEDDDGGEDCDLDVDFLLVNQKWRGSSEGCVLYISCMHYY